jgi:UDP-N-acetylmuramate--alanine ligase
VAGTHGKTTTTAILAHLFKSLNQSFTAFVGGIMNENQSNLMSNGDKVFLVEADEFDRSFLSLSPTLACVTSMDADHLDVYGNAEELKASYRLFAEKVSDKLIVEKGLPLVGVTYSIYEEADYYMTNIKPEGFGYSFDLITPNNRITGQYFSQLGLHNLSNALAAFALASSFGLSEKDLSSALSSFKGVKRRLQLHLENDNHVFIDDYAHHPTEIKAVYDTLENAYPGVSKCAIFQPHLFSRTRDFSEDFSKVLSLFDRVILLPIYPARELPIPGVHSDVLASKITCNDRVEVMSKEELHHEFSKISQRIKVVLGAGDIGREVEKLKQTI